MTPFQGLKVNSNGVKAFNVIFFGLQFIREEYCKASTLLLFAISITLLLHLKGGLLFSWESPQFLLPLVSPTFGQYKHGRTKSFTIFFQA